MALINCPECGKEISDRAESCPGCGMPVSTYDLHNDSEQSGESLKEKESGFGIASLILAILALFTGGLGILFFIISAILGIIALTQKDRKSVCSTISLCVFGAVMLISILLLLI